MLTVDSELGLAGVGGAEVVGDDALVAAFAGEVDAVQPQGGGVLGDVARQGAHVRLVAHLTLAQRLVVLLPGEGHGRVARAGRRAHERHVGPPQRRLRLRLHRDLRLREVVWSPNETVTFHELVPSKAGSSKGQFIVQQYRIAQLKFFMNVQLSPYVDCGLDSFQLPGE